MLKPVMIYKVDHWNDRVCLIKLEMSPKRISILTLEHFIGVRRAGLAGVVCLLILSARNWRFLLPAHLGIVLVFSAKVIVIENLIAELVEAVRAQVCHVVLVPHVDVQVPLRGVILVC